MRILQLSKKFPFPIKDGECLAITELGKSLSDNGAEVTLLAMDTTRHPAGNHIGQLDFYKKIYKVSVDNRILPWEAFLNLFSNKSFHIQRFESIEFNDKLKRVLSDNDFDIIQLETAYLAFYIPTIRKFSDAKIVLRTHNVEHEIWERIAENSRNPIKKAYLSHLAKKLRDFEIQQLDKIDFLAAISAKDLKVYKRLGYYGSADVVPIGLDLNEYHPAFGSYKNEMSIGFIGSLDWIPNQEGLKWFLDNSWNELKKKFPKLELHIAGRNAPRWIRDLKLPGVRFEGEVKCAKSFINNHSIMLVPILSGSGMRAKILEGMALGKVVLTTTIGLEGISARDKYEVLIADNSDQFISSLEYCYTSNGSLEKIGRNALDLMENKYDRNNISRSYLESLEKAFNLSPA